MPAGRAVRRPVRPTAGIVDIVGTVLRRLAPPAFAATLAAAALLPAAVQAQPVRVIPADAATAKLVMAAPTSTGPQTATLDGKTVGVAPGLRLFSPDNQLLTVAAVADKKLQVRYKLDLYGQLLTAWILSEPERKALQAN